MARATKYAESRKWQPSIRLKRKLRVNQSSWSVQLWVRSRGHWVIHGQILCFLCCWKSQTSCCGNWLPSFVTVHSITQYVETVKRLIGAPPQRPLVPVAPHHACLKHIVKSKMFWKELRHWISQPKQTMLRIFNRHCNVQSDAQLCNSVSCPIQS